MFLIRAHRLKIMEREHRPSFFSPCVLIYNNKNARAGKETNPRPSCCTKSNSPCEGHLLYLQGEAATQQPHDNQPWHSFIHSSIEFFETNLKRRRRQYHVKSLRALQLKGLGFLTDDTRGASHRAKCIPLLSSLFPLPVVATSTRGHCSRSAGPSRGNS